VFTRFFRGHARVGAVGDRLDRRPAGPPAPRGAPARTAR